MSQILVSDNVTITGGGSSTTPALVTRYTARRVSGNVFHAIQGSASHWVSLGPAHLRAGTFDLLYFDRSHAHEALAMHGAAATFTYVDADQPERNMSYAVEGRSEIVHNPESNSWRLSIEFQEIAS